MAGLPHALRVYFIDQHHFSSHQLVLAYSHTLHTPPTSAIYGLGGHTTAILADEYQLDCERISYRIAIPQ
jgi:tRNA A37 threonylcarbamoyltransferase TsaD